MAQVYLPLCFVVVLVVVCSATDPDIKMQTRQLQRGSPAEHLHFLETTIRHALLQATEKLFPKPITSTTAATTTTSTASSREITKMQKLCGKKSCQKIRKPMDSLVKYMITSVLFKVQDASKDTLLNQQNIRPSPGISKVNWNPMSGPLPSNINQRGTKGPRNLKPIRNLPMAYGKWGSTKLNRHRYECIRFIQICHSSPTLEMPYQFHL